MSLDESLTVHGNGTAKRDWLFVEDLAKAVDAAINSEKNLDGEVINIGTGRDIDVMSIAEKIVDVMGKPRSLISNVGERPGQVSRHTSSTKKAKELLDWEASVSFEEGISHNPMVQRKQSMVGKNTLVATGSNCNQGRRKGISLIRRFS